MGSAARWIYRASENKYAPQLRVTGFVSLITENRAWREDTRHDRQIDRQTPLSLSRHNHRDDLDVVLGTRDRFSLKRWRVCTLIFYAPFVIGALGPTVATVVAVALTPTQGTFREYASRLFRWRISPIWWLARGGTTGT
jgi:hypothetical protein